MSDTIEDFMGIFPNAASKEYCNRIITRFNYLQDTQSIWAGNGGRGKIWTRQEHENGIPSVIKENDTYFLGGTAGDHLPINQRDIILMSTDMSLLREFNQIAFNCYNKYKKKYSVLANAPTSIAQHKMSPAVRLQKYKPGQGYHVWHCDAARTATSNRIVVVALYLNTVEEGGETEFLYQKCRFKPQKNTLLIWPSQFTHVHRGNPPLSNDKYIITGWIEYGY